MKKAIGLTALILGVLSVSGCGKEEPEKVVPEATLSVESLVFDQSSSQKTVYVKLQGDGLAISAVESSASWCSASLEGESVLVSVSENETEQVRSALVTLSFSDETVADKTVKVAQESGTAKYLKTTAVDGYVFDCRGGEYKFTVEASDGWTASLVDCSWAEISTEGNLVCVKAGANEGDAVLEGRVKVTSGEASLEYSFTQARVADNAYLALLGEYDIYAEQWYNVTSVNSSLGYVYSKSYSGTLADLNDSNLSYYATTFSRTATLVENKYGESYCLNDFLLYGMNLPVNFDKETGNLSFPSMWNIGFVQQADKDYAAVFMVGCWVDGNVVRFDRYNPYVFPGAVSEDKNTITITTGLNTDIGDSTTLVPGSGICLVYMDMSLQSPALTPFRYMCFPYGDNVQLRRKVDAPEETPETPAVE